MALIACGDDGASSDAGSSDAGGVDAGAGDACVPQIEICGDRIDQNCDGRDQGCGDNDLDRYPACREGDDLTTCDCDDDQPTAYPGRTEECDGIDNDCNGRIDEVADCCAGCAGIDPSRADVCLEDGSCDCAGAEGVGPCAEGQTCCDSGCTDVATDVRNCGFCQRACDMTADNCAAGECRCGAGAACDFINTCTAGSCS